MSPGKLKRLVEMFLNQAGEAPVSLETQRKTSRVGHAAMMQMEAAEKAKLEHYYSDARLL